MTLNGMAWTKDPEGRLQARASTEPLSIGVHRPTLGKWTITPPLVLLPPNQDPLMGNKRQGRPRDNHQGTAGVRGTRAILLGEADTVIELTPWET